jgi:hypothetical protein
MSSPPPSLTTVSTTTVSRKSSLTPIDVSNQGQIQAGVQQAKNIAFVQSK